MPGSGDSAKHPRVGCTISATPSPDPRPHPCSHITRGSSHHQHEGLSWGHTSHTRRTLMMSPFRLPCPAQTLRTPPILRTFHFDTVPHFSHYLNLILCNIILVCEHHAFPEP
ncbi:hypothetical protein E2C01_043717 [Portunus trituberculatus]|uniref:Uncharacterized protein n=1 Tax=Portunus trituberculatus TaxID=210409 RepID=A0A5B7FTP2_PORTR|nr:hypothetical protein [Portunus trituberculatus]